MSSMAIPKVVPAQLSFLAVYNPSLGVSDETFHDQVVFYYSKAAKARATLDGSAKKAQTERSLREEENEKLRQVGLAQGMVGFARSFSNGESVDSVDTARSRIVLQELESGWWILASVDLTQLPGAATTPSKTDAKNGKTSGPPVEYSAREVSPPALLLQQLLRAHSIFLLHHAATLNNLWVKLERTKFCGILDRYWSRFASNWDVLLHGNPAVDIYGGLKLAAGGELGMGVGEEEWGSGEREVLEDHARRTEGLVDVLVSRFGEPSPHQNPKSSAVPNASTDTPLPEPWMGSGRHAGASDGIVFSGIGALSRRSLRDISQWIESIYCLGEYAYGVRDNPTTNRRKRRRRTLNAPSFGEGSLEISKSDHGLGTSPIRDMSLPPGIPPPIVSAVERSLDKASNAVDANLQAEANNSSKGFTASLGDAETWMKYMSLGYGTAWGGKKPQNSEETSRSELQPETDASPEVTMRYIDPEPDIDHFEEKLKAQIQSENAGYFLIGLKGDMSVEDPEDGDEEWNNRIVIRTLHAEVTSDKILGTPGGGSSFDDETPFFDRQPNWDQPRAPPVRKLTRLRPVIYVHRPFIYTFLFHHHTPSLSMSYFYRDLHTYFSPLHRPLSNSTSPSKVAARIAAASNPHTTVSSTAYHGTNTQPIYDLVYDPRTLTVHANLPNIPEPGSPGAEGLAGKDADLAGWTRVEALNVHSQILATVAGTRRGMAEIERTCKTARSWWVVWMRLPPSMPSPEDRDRERDGDGENDREHHDLGAALRPSSSSSHPSANTHTPANTNMRDPTTTTTTHMSQEFNTAELREAFLVRRARDGGLPAVKSSGALGLGSRMWRLGGQKGLLSLNR
ncbi:hypothetical protein P154DRAFT_544359 [Amniculicola lignicola CBS 123094]|uniref:CCZ1/INTU/HSP4 first Longin domain-containing protein n=1 Tax=Amniculicola lignicola CBS 123094 TaxID=1392246 RepID=A0A6A5WLF4_9PLEO|nr:hypothetical protein P154DRAFT_544359 [Amniculicola lignicola CBS 123094]